MLTSYYYVLINIFVVANLRVELDKVKENGKHLVYSTIAVGNM